ncbi:hypothetical protein ACWC2H_31015 [Streptomyces sp. 900105755]
MILWPSAICVLGGWRRWRRQLLLSDLEQVLPELDEADDPSMWRLWQEMTRLIVDTDPHPIN